MNIADIEARETYYAERYTATAPNDVAIIVRVNLGGPVSENPPF